MFCCTTLEPNLHKGSPLEATQKPFCIVFPKISSDKFDVVDNPHRWKNVSGNLENKALFEAMKCEKNRKDSFDKKWPLQYINIDDLVESGFFYLQSDDKVQCAFCKLVLCSWKPGDRPMKEHIKSSPKCSFLEKTQNMPPQCFPYLMKGNAFKPNKPKNPRMIDLEARLSTFKNWPHAAGIRVQDLADCGLYYTGIQDIVTCFYCGGSLLNWEPSDEPIVEHAKFYPECNYLRIIQTRPVYKKFFSAETSISIAAEGNSSILQAQDIVQKAKEIFPSSLVEKVVVQHLQKGGKFPSLHHLCEEILQHKDRLSPKIGKSKVVPELSCMSTKKAEVENDMLLCKICMDREREVVFQPCGHLISCEKCAALITNCPLCRKHIDARMRTFLS